MNDTNKTVTWKEVLDSFKALNETLAKIEHQLKTGKPPPSDPLDTFKEVFKGFGS
jgi:hypothetical protein